MLDLVLDHLREDEVKHIQQVLERDAYIQSQEETRRKKLQGSIRKERIPEKRLSLKLRTGEWMSEMTSPNRTSLKRGSEIVRASIRKKISTKKKTRSVKEEKSDNKSKHENGLIENEHMTEVNLTPDTEPERVVQNGQPVYTDEAKKSDQAVDVSSYKPLRKTSIRRKKLSTSDKQVKFDTDKTKKFVYVQTSVDSDSQNKTAQEIPSIVIDDGEEKIKIETVEIKPEVPAIENKQASDASSYDSAVYSTPATFESYHNAFAKEMYKAEEKVDENVATVAKNETTSPKVKKVRVVKRKGSTRRKPGPKLTDDDSRDTLFNMPDATVQAEENKAADIILDEIIASATQDSIDKTESRDVGTKKEAPVEVEVSNDINKDSAAEEVAAELLKMVTEHTSHDEKPYEDLTSEHLTNVIADEQIDVSKITEDLDKTKEELIEVTLEQNIPAEPMDDIGKNLKEHASPLKQGGSPNQTSTVSGLSDEIMKEYEKMTTTHDDIIELEFNVEPEINNENKSSEKIEMNPVSNDKNEIEIEEPEKQKSPEKKLAISTTLVDDRNKDDEDSIPDLVATYQHDDVTNYGINGTTTKVPTDSVYEHMAPIVKSLTSEKQEPVVKTEDSREQGDSSAFELMSNISRAIDNNQTEEDSNYDTTSTVKDETENVTDKAETKKSEYIPDAIADIAASVLNTEEKSQEESPTKTDKPKKKVVKKVIKKKKPVEAEEQGSPKSEPQQEIETPEEPQLNMAPKLSRTRTVRKKVIKKKPPTTAQ